jgi:hypothetical protein
MKPLRLSIRARRAARLLTPDGFALAPLWVQLAAIFASSALVILLCAPLLGSLSQSYRLFSDPSSYADAEGFSQLFFGFFQMGFGLMLFSFIISVLSSALEQLIERIRGGTRPYRKCGHLFIVNRNAKLPLILDEINERYARLGQPVDVVLLLGSRDKVGQFCDGLKVDRWMFLHLFVRQGDLFAFETYERLSIFSATGVVLLANEGANSVFATDNLNLKILTTLTNHEAYWQHLVQHQIRKQPIKCGVELSSELQSRTVALSLTAYGSESLFSVNTPGNVIGRVLSRSIIDIVYYKIFLEIFSFHGHAIYFVDPHQFAAHGVAPGMSFESLSRGFSQGLLIGFSQIEAAGVSLRLVPSGQVLAPNDWLIVIARNPEALVFDPTPASQLVDGTAITPPSEICRRSLCVIGAARTFDDLPAFLHADCRASLREAHFVFPTIEQYFEPAFVSRLHAGAYDTIIINLEDDPGFRFTLFILAQFPSNDPFLAKIITVLTDPVLEGLLNEHAKYRNTILSDKLAAKYTTQLLFQKNLEHLYNELSAPEGAEFNLLDVGVHIPRNFLTTKQAVKDLLLTHGLVYVGTVDQQKDVHIDADRFEGVHQLVVISHGEY